MPAAVEWAGESGVPGSAAAAVRPRRRPFCPPGEAERLRAGAAAAGKRKSCFAVEEGESVPAEKTAALPQREGERASKRQAARLLTGRLPFLPPWAQTKLQAIQREPARQGRFWERKHNKKKRLTSKSLSAYPVFGDRNYWRCQRRILTQNKRKES